MARLVRVGKPLQSRDIETGDFDALVATMTARGHEFRNPACDDGKFRYVMIAAPDDLLIEFVEWRELEWWWIPSR